MFLGRLLKQIKGESPRFKCGVMLILLCPLVSWIGVPAFGILAAKYRSAILGIVAFGLYIVTWVMTFVGFAMAGERGKSLVLSIFRKGGDDKFCAPHTERER